MTAPERRLRAGDRVLELGGRPRLMGIVNASPDSFSDGGVHATLDSQLQLARELVAAGADMLDVGGESATTGRPPVAVQQEIERVVPLVQRIVGELDTIVSVIMYAFRSSCSSGQLLIMDLNFCVRSFLLRIRVAGAFFLVRRHAQNLPYRELGPPEVVGHNTSGTILEQAIEVEDRMPPARCISCGGSSCNWTGRPATGTTRSCW